MGCIKRMNVHEFAGMELPATRNSPGQPPRTRHAPTPLRGVRPATDQLGHRQTLDLVRSTHS
jgi:hypothetical protein